MSQGAFDIYGYASDKGSIHPIRCQPETAEGENDPLTPIGPGLAFFRRGGSRRRYGNFARFISLSKPLGSATANTPYASAKVYAKVTIFAKDVFDGLAVGADYTYLSQTFRIVSKTSERVS